MNITIGAASFSTKNGIDSTWDGVFANGSYVNSSQDVMITVSVTVNDLVALDRYSQLVPESKSYNWDSDPFRLCGPLVDLDVDSNNDGIISTDTDYDPDNDDGFQEELFPGKLIYLNRDNDNKNITGAGDSARDKEDQFDFDISAPTSDDDNDLQPLNITLSSDIPDESIIKLETTASTGQIAIWSSPQRGPNTFIGTPVPFAGTVPSGVPTPSGFGGMQWTYYKTPPPNPTPPIPTTLYIEGIHPGEINLKLSVDNSEIEPDTVRLGIVDVIYDLEHSVLPFGKDDGETTFPHPCSSNGTPQVTPQLYKCVSLDADVNDPIIHRIASISYIVNPHVYRPFVFFSPRGIEQGQDDSANINVSLYGLAGSTLLHIKGLASTNKESYHAHVISRLGTNIGASADWLKVAAYKNEEQPFDFYVVQLPGETLSSWSPDISTINNIVKQAVCSFSITINPTPVTVNYDTNGNGMLDTTPGNDEKSLVLTALGKTEQDYLIIHLGKVASNNIPGTVAAGLADGNTALISDGNKDMNIVLAHELFHINGLSDLGRLSAILS